MTLFLIYMACVVLWGLGFVLELGFRRAFLISLCRGLWILPLILSLIPSSESKELPRSIVKTPVHVLVDDSESMKPFEKQKTQFMDKLRSLCRDNACELKEKILSNENTLTRRGYTPLRQVLGNWFASVSHDPWILLSDGGDSIPRMPWPREWSGIAKDAQKKISGLLVGVKDEGNDRLWIENVTISPVSFEGRTSPL